jgi:thymidylate synthase (FAD)
MKIIKNQGKFVVLTKPTTVISSIAEAARTCYQSSDKSNLESDEKLVRNLMNREHGAMLEFVDMTVRFDNCSRGLTHELVRHRLCSFAQESTRYVDEKDFEFVVPPHKDEEDYDGGVFSFRECLETIGNYYRMFRKRGWKPEDARQILPNALVSQITVKANVREWRHIFKMRCDFFAHWEIRAVMCDLLKWCQSNIPIIFDDFQWFNLDGIEYARPIPSISYIMDLLKHAKEVYGSELTNKIQEKYCNLS